MKTRIISTDIWDSEEIYMLNIDTKLLYLLLLTNSYIGQTRVFKITNRIISAYSGLNIEQIEYCKKQLIEKGFIETCDDWYLIKSDIGYVESNYRGKKNEVARNREIDKLSDKVRNKFQLSISMAGLGNLSKYEKSGLFYKHVKIAESVIGRKLNKDEIVHHLDHSKSNNDISNLCVIQIEDHNKIHSGNCLITEIADVIYLSDRVSDLSDTSLNHKSEIINNKSGIINNKLGIKNNKPVLKIKLKEIDELLKNKKITIKESEDMKTSLIKRYS